MLSQSLGAMLAPPAVSTVGRYDTIDLIRGIAAIAMLFWHYQHFIALGLAVEGSRTSYPLYGIFWPFYELGGVAIQFFWIVSGFVFAAVYYGRSISTRNFVIHRVARLYPLHLLTLIAVIILQFVNLRMFGRALIYPMGGISEFARQLALGSGWGSHAVFTFNGPVWSVSAEVLVYVFFWLLLPWLLRWGIALPMVVAVTARVLLPGWPVAECAFYFFTGVTIFSVSQATSTTIAGAIAVTLLVAAIGICWSGRIGIGLYIGFSSLTLACGLLDQAGMGRICAKVPWISENCYGSYLAHIPIQLAMLLGLAMIGQSRAIAFSPYFLIAYLALVTIVARLLFVYVEKPARSALRCRLEAR